MSASLVMDRIDEDAVNMLTGVRHYRARHGLEPLSGPEVTALVQWVLSFKGGGFR